LDRIVALALGSLAAFVVAMVLYGYRPLPTGAFDWRTPAAWIPVAILVLGLIAFVVFLTTGLIALLNRGTGRPPRDRDRA
jgi:hypothetical protein